MNPLYEVVCSVCSILVVLHLTVSSVYYHDLLIIWNVISSVFATLKIACMLSDFNPIDILRIIGGILFFNAFLSWWFTSLPTWGYQGKYIDTQYYLHQISGPVNFTSSELSQYKGIDSGKIYVAVNGSVYDVSSSPKVYGPGGSYHQLTGKDCARVYVTGCFQNEDQFTHDLRGLNEQEATKDISGWQKFFANHPKYWYAGVVHNEMLSGDLPKSCMSTKYHF